jgi:hypothetical protein
LKLAAVLIVASLALAGCAGIELKGYTTIEPIQDGLLVARVAFYDSWALASNECERRGLPFGGACAVLDQSAGLPQWFIITRRPRGFDDLEAICGLGHEVGHVLGGQHVLSGGLP